MAHLYYLWIRWSFIICFDRTQYFLKTAQFIGSGLNLLFWCLGLRSARSPCVWRALPERCLREIREDVVLVQRTGCEMTSHLSGEVSEWGKSSVFLASGTMNVITCLLGIDDTDAYTDQGNVTSHIYILSLDPRAEMTSKNVLFSSLYLNFVWKFFWSLPLKQILFSVSINSFYICLPYFIYSVCSNWNFFGFSFFSEGEWAHDDFSLNKSILYTDNNGNNAKDVS